MTADHGPLERRGLAESAQIESGTGGPVLTGYALRFDSPSEPLPGRNGATFIETIDRGALARLHEGRGIKFLIAHDPGRVVGSTRGGTLRLSVDDIGLRFTLTPPSSPDGENLVEAVKRGDLDAMSFGFKVRADAWRDGPPPTRVLKDVDIFELSAVCWGAYSAAGIAVENRAQDHAAAV